MSRLIVFAILGSLAGQPRIEVDRFTWSARDFEVTRALLPGGDVELTIAGGGELIPLAIRIGGPQRLRIARASNVVWGLWELGRVKAMADGRAVTAFRERVGDYERALIAGRPPADEEPQACGFLLAGALVSALAGDPAAGSRARDLIMQRVPRIGERRGEETTCVAAWRRDVNRADATRSACLLIADSREGWSERMADRTLCEAEFLAAFTVAETRHAACRAPSG